MNIDSKTRINRINNVYLAPLITKNDMANDDLEETISVLLRESFSIYAEQHDR